MLAILHLLWAFVANLFKSPRRLEQVGNENANQLKETEHRIS